MTTRFCHFCGHGPVTIMEFDGEIFCSDCHAIYYLGNVKQKPTITEEEADTLFTKKELTEYQKTGSKKSWRRKK
jgi:uncharacterized Zn finger protein (UPF0148 family)